MTAPSALISVSRGVTGFWGYRYGSNKRKDLKGYVRMENRKKLAQLKEVGLDPESLRGQTFHAPAIHDPWYTEQEIAFRERNPDYYLSPADEYAYQVKKKREKLEYLFQQRALAARAVAKEEQPGYHSYTYEEVVDIAPVQPIHAQVAEDGVIV